MKSTQHLTLASALFFSVVPIDAHAALYDRGNGMIYDSTQNITWLQDANYAGTTGYSTIVPGMSNSPGVMTWSQAKVWADNLVYGGYQDWRLPSAKPNGNYNWTYDGSSSLGYNTHSEIAQLYAELGNQAECSGPSQCISTGYGFIHTSFVDASGQSVSFLNVQNTIYWENEEWAPNTIFGWAFFPNYGYQNGLEKTTGLYAWAVRDGDVANVSDIPVPAAAWLFGSGLIGLVGASRRKAA